MALYMMYNSWKWARPKNKNWLGALEPGIVINNL